MDSDVQLATPGLIQEFARTAHPDAVQRGVAELVQRCGEHAHHASVLHAVLADPQARFRLGTLLGNSPWLAQLALRWPQFMDDLRVDPPAPGMLRTHLLEEILAVSAWDDAAAVLRRFKHRCYLRIGAMDLTGEAALMETTGAISQVAECCLEAGYQWLYRRLCGLYGRPLAATGEASRFVILGMGKLGGRELNFSSDIDLIFLYDQDEGGTEGPQRQSIKAFYSRLGRELIKLMQEPTAEGRVFRVDLRLRPEGESGDLCISCRSAEIYYESWGQTWERAAMLKARPVAGDIALGEEMLQRLQPFIYRRYLDFASLDAIREMKLKIDRKMQQADDYRRNVKLGYGGIREIEFLVQSHQLVHGGKRPALRVRGTLEALEQLVGHDLLEPAVAATLAEAYQFLRCVEHALQIVRDQQTHSLPEDPEEFDALARRLRFGQTDALRERLATVTEQVHGLYGGLFVDSRAAAAESPGASLLEALAGESTTEGHWQQVGISRTDQAVNLVTLLRDGPKGMQVTEAGRIWYQRLGPLLLERLVRTPDPDMAVRHAEAFLNRIGRRTSYVAMLVQKPVLLDLLVTLFGSSVYLCRYLNTHLELLDTLISQTTANAFLEQPVQRGALTEQLARRMIETTSPEQHAQTLHEFRSSEIMRIGIRDLIGRAELTEVMISLSTLAEVILTRVLADARAELEQKYGVPYGTSPEGERRPAQFAIVAMGKLGGRELNYASDLDLIFIHDSPEDVVGTEGGPRSVTNTQFFNTLGQRIIRGITTWTRAGRLYELDMRLRPSGNSGPLVTSLASFCHYHRTSAWTWEHQALTRAHVIAGDTELSARLRQEIHAIVTLPREPGPLRQEIREMRERLWREKGPPPGQLDLKQSRGGMVDIEFVVQYLLLGYGARVPSIVQRNLASALLGLRKAGLLTPEECTRLHDHYHRCRFVENRLHLLLDRSEHRLPQEPGLRRHLARLCQGGEHMKDVDGDTLQDVLQQQCDEIWDLCQVILDREPVLISATSRSTAVYSAVGGV